MFVYSTHVWKRYTHTYTQTHVWKIRPSGLPGRPNSSS